MKRSLIFVLFVFACSSIFLFAEPKKKDSIPVSEWYLTSPYLVPKFAYGKENETEWKKRILSEEKINFKKLWADENSKDCTIVKADKKNILTLTAKKSDAVYGFLTYLSTERWTKTIISIKHTCPIAIFLDGVKLSENIEPKGSVETSAELILKRGLHRIGFSVLTESGKENSFEVNLKKCENYPFPKSTLSPLHPLSWDDVLSVPFVVDTQISTDGSLAALVLQHNDTENDKRFTTIQLRDCVKGNLIFDSGPITGISFPTFDRNNKYLAFLAKSQEEGKQDIWILDLNSMAMQLVCKNIENPKSLNFSPDSSTLYFIANAPRKKEEKKPPYDRLTEMYQRWGDWKNRPHLFSLDLERKSLSQITAGESNLFDYSLSADGKKIALLRGVFTVKRPYLKSEIYLYDLEKFSSKKILSWEKWPDISEIALSPDGTKIAVMSSRGDMPEGGLKPKEHLAYNLNLFVVDVESGNYTLLTENFRPSFSSQAISVYPPRKNIYWNEEDNLIYFFATDKDRILLYKMNVLTKEFSLINFGEPVLSSPSISFRSGQVLFFSSALGKFWQVKIGDLKSLSSKTLWFPGEDILSRVKLGLLEPFDVIARDGEIIQGWLLYPPDYEKTKKYPTIVAYYGGVMPYGRAFRSEFFWLAGQGYIVYIVTPRGSVGYGQDFADAHCNDWGKEAGEDIIEGVKALIRLKPSVDKTKIGCFGGSYGGFMTLYLIGKSDLFSAAVDYFGISNIASYWGAGWWGFNYGDTAIANSYPWTRKDVFVDRSPLYFADRINTPLLLLHGTSDTNVPSTESDQIFTALRVQDKKVEYVRFFGEDHGINSKPSVRIASEEMMLEWFDKFLKGEGEAWDYRWKNETKPIEDDFK